MCFFRCSHKFLINFQFPICRSIWGLTSRCSSRYNRRNQNFSLEVFLSAPDIRCGSRSTSRCNGIIPVISIKYKSSAKSFMRPVEGRWQIYERINSGMRGSCGRWINICSCRKPFQLFQVSWAFRAHMRGGSPRRKTWRSY